MKQISIGKNMTDINIRHYNPILDLAALSSMLTEIESFDHDGEDTSEAYLLASLQWPNYRPDQDVWVAQEDGKLVGYAVTLEQPSRQCTIYVVVHPSRRRKGFGSELFQLTLNRAHELSSDMILIHANERNTASNEFLKHHGFSPVGSSGTMRVNSSMSSSPIELPAGFTLRQYCDINEPRVLLTALDECYLDMWGHQHHDQRTEEELRSPRFLQYYQADDILILFDDRGDISGICTLKSEGKRDEDGTNADLLDAPGVIQKHRQDGYQRQLVLAGMEHLRKNGTRPIILEFWGESQDALNIYRALGFEMLHHFITYNKDLK